MSPWLVPDSSVNTNTLEFYSGYSYMPTFSLNIIMKLEALRDPQGSLSAFVL